MDAGYIEYIWKVHDINLVWLDGYGCKQLAFCVSFDKKLMRKNGFSILGTIYFSDDKFWQMMNIWNFFINTDSFFHWSK